MTSILGNEKIGAVLVCGAGVAGIQASLDLAGSGFKVYLLDSQAAIGGRMAQLDEAFPTGDCAMCILSPKLVECARNRNIEIITLADIQSVSGRPGSFKVKIRQNPRYIDIKKCDACGNCAEACPVNLPNEGGSGMRKAIFRPNAQAIPNVFTISKAAGQAPCKVYCPAGVNVQGATALIAAGKLTEAYALIRQRCPIPASCGRVCLHPCESFCNRKSVDEAVAFGDLERFVGDYIRTNPDLYPAPVPSLHLSDRKVAVIGGGPAGLTAATDLALMGYGVTLFEAKAQLGGMLRYGIPGYRLPKDILDKEIQSIADSGVEVKTNTAIARPKDLLKSNAPPIAGSALADGYNAVFVATGAWMSRKLGIPGEDAQGVRAVLDFLFEVNTGNPPQIGPNVLVIGGSALAVDAARCAARIPGVKSVRLACIESLSEMPVPSEQAAHALDEGVIFHNSLGPTRIEARGECVSSVIFRACTSVFDIYRGFKRHNPLFDDSQVSELQADTVIVAVGREVDAKRLGMEIRPGGRILTDKESLSTSVRGIFAGGDAVLGPASVADAIAQGHTAAEAIDTYIRGAANIRSTDALRLSTNLPPRSNQVKFAPNPMPNALRQDRVRMSQTSPAGRLQSRNEIYLGYSMEQAVLEAQRCLSCGLCSECLQCVKACSAEAILQDQLPAEIDVEVGSIIIAQGMEEMAERLAPEMNQSGFAQTQPLSPLVGSRPGIYLAGAFQELKDIPESVVQGSAAAACAMEQLTAVRGTMIQHHEYPWEQDIADELPRIGVFVCHCGHNISSIIDVDGAVRHAAGLPNVCHAEATLYTCSEANQQHIKEMIRKHRLNRLVVASCSSRTHEVLFQETLRESGLNRYLFAMTNIRDQCSWVHKQDPAAATAKAIDLVSMAVARARHLKQLPLYELPVTASALILGGGLAGMTAAQSIAGQGYKVHLVERGSLLGGLLKNSHTTLEHADVQTYVQQLINKIQSDPKINVYLNSDLIRISGQVGNFTSVLKVAGTETAIDHGVVVVATGGLERSTRQFLHGKNPNVITQSKLESMLHGASPLSESDGKQDPTIVMIQCVESRDETHPYCSRVCCSEAVKNALEIKRRLPRSRIVVLGRDFRPFGLREEFYKKALDQGILFVHYPENRGPQVVEEAGRLKVIAHDAMAGRDLILNPDLLVLSTGISPAVDNPTLSRILRSALTDHGFFLEAHPKLRPVDLANEGEFLCGLAHSPCFMDETIQQAQAVAARASTILSKAQLEIMGQIAFVNPAACVACATCVKICPYGAPTINELRKAEIQSAKCMGCGSCTAACPSRAIMLQYQEGETMVAMFDELLVSGGSR
jgi:heterodisulfide reductase subunit A-like polyferredoxin